MKGCKCTWGSETGFTFCALHESAPELLNALRWSINHQDECLGDYPELLNAAKTLVAKAEVRT